MKAKKIQKIKVFKFYDNNNSDIDYSEIEKEIEKKINKFINSDEVESVIDIKINTPLENLYIKTGPSYHCSGSTSIAIYYTVIYYPA